MDELAVELDIEPMELRKKNWITHEEFPFTTVVGLTYDSGNYEQATAQAMESFDYAGFSGGVTHDANTRWLSNAAEGRNGGGGGLV